MPGSDCTAARSATSTAGTRPDKDTFVITLKKVQPTFLEILSSFSAPIVIVPAEEKDDPPMQLKSIGTGPWQLVESIPGGYVKLKRYDGYKPNTNFEQKTGFGGYKQACFNTVTFRIVTEPQARVAGLKTGELQGVEDLPTKSLPDLKTDSTHHDHAAAELVDSDRPAEHVRAAHRQSDVPQGGAGGARHGRDHGCGVGWQLQAERRIPVSESGHSTPMPARRPTTSRTPPSRRNTWRNPAIKGEPVILLTDKDYPAMYNSALVMQQQMQAIGINAQLKVVDWPTSAQMALQIGHRLEPVLHRLGHAAGTRRARHHAVLC